MTREAFDLSVHWPADNVVNWPGKDGDFYKKTVIHMYYIKNDKYLCSSKYIERVRSRSIIPVG